MEIDSLRICGTVKNCSSSGDRSMLIEDSWSSNWYQSVKICGLLQLKLFSDLWLQQAGGLVGGPGEGGRKGSKVSGKGKRERGRMEEILPVWCGQNFSSNSHRHLQIKNCLFLKSRLPCFFFFLNFQKYPCSKIIFKAQSDCWQEKNLHQFKFFYCVWRSHRMLVKK